MWQYDKKKKKMEEQNKKKSITRANCLHEGAEHEDINGEGHFSVGDRRDIAWRVKMAMKYVVKNKKW